MKQRWIEFWERNKVRLTGAAIGLLIGILMLTINFWRTLLLCLLVAVGYVIGILLEPNGREKISDIIKRILPQRK